MTTETAINAIEIAINSAHEEYNRQNLITNHSIPLDKVETYEKMLSGLNEAIEILKTYTEPIKGEENV